MPAAFCHSLKEASSNQIVNSASDAVSSTR